MSNLRRRIGRLTIEDRLMDHTPEVLAKVFSLLKFVPIRAEYTGCDYEVIGLSSQFEEIMPGTRAPFYIIEISMVDNKLTEVKAKKVEPQKEAYSLKRI